MPEPRACTLNPVTAVIAAAADRPPADSRTAFIDLAADVIERVDGAVGEFKLVVRAGSAVRTVTCGAIVVLGRTRRAADKPMEKRFRDLLAGEARQFNHRKIGVLLDRDYPADEAVWRELLPRAAAIVHAGGAVDILCREAEVGFDGGQALYRAGREVGVRFIRYAGTPKVKAGTVTIDHAVIRSPLQESAVTLTYDFLAAPGRLVTPPALASVLDRLRVFADREGLPVRGNLRLSPPATNVRGIWYGDAESGAAALAEARRFAAGGDLACTEPAVLIDGKRCAACLTCVRICPMRAAYIAYDEELKLNRAYIDAAACGGCGTCAGECPADAISVESFREVAP